MSRHIWNDSWEHWGDLEKAGEWVFKQVKKNSLCTLVYKEKWGSLRYEFIVPPGGHAICRKYAIKAPWRRHVRGVGCYRPTLWAWTSSRLYYKWVAKGWEETAVAVLKAVEKWPHLKDELLEDLAANEDLVGKDIHDRYWTGCGSKGND